MLDVGQIAVLAGATLDAVYFGLKKSRLPRTFYPRTSGAHQQNAELRFDPLQLGVLLVRIAYWLIAVWSSRDYFIFYNVGARFFVLGVGLGALAIFPAERLVLAQVVFVALVRPCFASLAFAVLSIVWRLFGGMAGVRASGAAV